MTAHPSRRSAAQRLGRRWWLMPLVLAIAGLVAADRLGLLLTTRHDDLAMYHGRSAEVIGVVSPHTIEISHPDALSNRPRTRVRLWGVNAPLPARPGRPAQALSGEAMRLTRDAAQDALVMLHLEAHRPRDTFGRILAHVEMPNGELLNTMLLEAGLAKTDERWPHRHLKRYARAQNSAQRHKRGLWSQDVAEE